MNDVPYVRFAIQEPAPRLLPVLEATLNRLRQAYNNGRYQPGTDRTDIFSKGMDCGNRPQISNAALLPVTGNFPEKMPGTDTPVLRQLQSLIGYRSCPSRPETSVKPPTRFFSKNLPRFVRCPSHSSVVPPYEGSGWHAGMLESRRPVYSR